VGALTSGREALGAGRERNLQHGIFSQEAWTRFFSSSSDLPSSLWGESGFTSRASCFVPRAPRGTRAGFTLLELLVVIVIMGIAAGVVSLSVAPSEERLWSEEGKRLAALFRLAQVEARAQGRPIAWQADERGYRFVSADKVREGPNDALRARDWPVVVRSVVAPDVVFGAEPLLPPVSIRIETVAGARLLEMDAFGTLIVKR
jgi:general secretion pathway protein H